MSPHLLCSIFLVLLSSSSSFSASACDDGEREAMFLEMERCIQERGGSLKDQASTCAQVFALVHCPRLHLSGPCFPPDFGAGYSRHRLDSLQFEAARERDRGVIVYPEACD